MTDSDGTFGDHEDDFDDAFSLDDLDDDFTDDDELDGGVIPDDYDDDLDDLGDDDDDYDDDDDDLDDDDYQDATLDEIDFVVALYREDGEPEAMRLAPQLANDLEDLIEQLRRLPADAGSTGVVSIDGDFFVLCRVRGRNVQVLLSDVSAALDWPLARDVVDYLGVDMPDDDDDSEPIGDFDILADQGVSDFDIEHIAGDLDEDSDQLVARIVAALGFTKVFNEATD